ncbi:MAG: KpsF/GutQ family sugar-phosphate isomerase [Pseudoalteromonas distincta]|uniref:KpsF/GutQ family sugar-phosphate isomerase n=1 Tax=Pseudoalteromonas distincta TaxID=77608 RepID=UPI003F98A018
MDIIGFGKEAFDIEIDALKKVRDSLDAEFSLVVKDILVSKGRVIVCGMGKSGIIGKKIAASLASTGTPSFFMHPGEAFHGDLGMVTPNDIFIAISNSGETDEVLKLLPFLKDNGNKIVVITGNSKSSLASHANYTLNIEVSAEACPLQLAPTASTTATLAMGDALTVALMKVRDFQPANFARFHPGGTLGRRLLNNVSDEMVTKNLPKVDVSAPITDVINIMSEGTLGLTLVMKNNQINAIITDGDLRRAIEKYNKNLFDLKASDIASNDPELINPNASMAFAYELMQKKHINCLIVCDGIEVVGIIKK